MKDYTEHQAREVVRAALPWAKDIQFRFVPTAPRISRWGIRATNKIASTGGFPPPHFGACGYGLTLRRAVLSLIATARAATRAKVGRVRRRS